MMETIRARNGQAQPAYGYSSASYDGIQFSDPWARTNAPMLGHVVASSIPSDNSAIPSMSRPLRNSLSSPFNLIPTSRNTSSPPVYATEIFPSNEMMNKFSTASYEPTSAPSVTSGMTYGGMTSGGSGYSSSSYEQMQNRNNNLQNSLIDYPRPQPSSGSYANSREGSLTDALDSARGMMALSQTDTRLPLTNSHRNSSVASANGYYPGSTTSSISSNQSYPYFGSMDSSSTELSSTDGMYDSSRPSLPRPAGMIQSHGMPLQSGAQSMMSTFSSRVSSSTQKKHKCKICDKRFTRPSSLQTHMYSHTGEKPFACDVDGCGRQFSVVSNLRRHRKVHKGLPDMDTCSNHSG